MADDIEKEVQRRIKERDRQHAQQRGSEELLMAIGHIKAARLQFGAGSLVEAKTRYPLAYQALQKIENELDYISCNPQ